MTLVPAQARQLAPMLVGTELEVLMVEVAQQLRDIDRRYKALKATKADCSAQQPLALAP